MALLEQEAQCSQVLLSWYRQMLLLSFDSSLCMRGQLVALDIGITFKEEPLSKRACDMM